MAKRTVHIRRNADGTYTVRVGKSVEHFSGDKSKSQLFDAIKYACISKEVPVSDVEITEILQEIGN